MSKLRKKKIGVFFILLVIVLFTLVACFHETGDIKDTEPIISPNHTKESSEVPVEIEITESINLEPLNTYSIIVRDNITQDQADVYKNKINGIHNYLESKALSLNEIEYVLSSFARIDLEKNRVYVDVENTTDFELLRMIIVHNFSEFAHYGLSVGLINQIANELGLAVTTYEEQPMEYIISNWDDLHLGIVNFTPEIASQEEIAVAKYLAVQVTDYIVETQGIQSLWHLLEVSKTIDGVLLVTELMDQWLYETTGEKEISRSVPAIVFKQNSGENSLEFMTDNIGWTLFLNVENNNPFHLSMHDSTQEFYRQMTLHLDEIDRLEDYFAYKGSDLGYLEVIIYAGNKVDTLGGYYDGRVINLNSTATFSHEYIHFLDDELDMTPPYRAQSEMRAVYYSSDNQMNQDYIELILDEYRPQLVENMAYFEETNPFLDAEALLGREMNYRDYVTIFYDLYVYAYITEGYDTRSLFEIANHDNYPEELWISLMNYLINTYTEEAMMTIMNQQKLPDGTFKNLETVIEEWKAYFSVYNPEDYLKKYEDRYTY